MPSDITQADIKDERDPSVEKQWDEAPAEQKFEVGTT